jgi:hypothetical protein
MPRSVLLAYQVEAFPAGVGPHAKEALANIPDCTDRVPVRSSLSFLLDEL